MKLVSSAIPQVPSSNMPGLQGTAHGLSDTSGLDYQNHFKSPLNVVWKGGKEGQKEKEGNYAQPVPVPVSVLIQKRPANPQRAVFAQ